MSPEVNSENVQKVRIGDKEFLVFKVVEDDIHELQEKIRKFAEDREWTNKLDDPRDYLLGIVEEVGEFRNFIKWLKDRETVDRMIKENYAEVEDLLGDIIWFVIMLANRCGIDIRKAINRTIKDNENRYSVELVKGKHTNVYAGGVDLKFKKTSGTVI